MSTTLNYRIGQKIGRYEIVQLLGQGAMALVYKAFDPFIDRTLAIKVLREERCIDSEYRVRFLREAKAAGNLSHPNIVTIYDIGEFENRPYIVMELLEGTPLDKLMASGRTFTTDETVEIGIQLATALDYAHKNGVVHRDIKPSNILCSISPNNKIKVKITDFGIAHVSDSDLTQQTQTGAVLGTPYYISPEQVLGQKVDGRSDLFCLGVTMYHLFTGQRPFDGATFHTLLYQIATEDPRPIIQILPNFPIQLKNVIDKLLQKQPDDRYRSGHELVEALQHATSDIKTKGPRQHKSRLLPISVKFTLSMVIILSISALATIFFVQHQQQQYLINHITKLGKSYTSFIADQSAESVLREDWFAIELFVKQTGNHTFFNYLSILDHNGIIRADSKQENVGRTFVLPTNRILVSETDQLNVYRYFTNDSTPDQEFNPKTLIQKLFHFGMQYEFSAPVLYHKKSIGRVYIGLSTDILDNLIEKSLQHFVLICVFMIAIAAVVVYLLSTKLAKPNRLIKTYMDEIAGGNFTLRITKERKDEIGLVYKSFNQMADKLQQREIRKKSNN